MNLSPHCHAPIPSALTVIPVFPRVVVSSWVVNLHSPIFSVGAAHQFDFNQSAAQAGRVGVETGQYFVDLLLAILAIRRELFDDVLEQRLKFLLLRRYLFERTVTVRKILDHFAVVGVEVKVFRRLRQSFLRQLHKLQIIL